MTRARSTLNKNLNDKEFMVNNNNFESIKSDSEYLINTLIIPLEEDSLSQKSNYNKFGNINVDLSKLNEPELEKSTLNIFDKNEHGSFTLDSSKVLGPKFANNGYNSEAILKDDVNHIIPISNNSYNLGAPDTLDLPNKIGNDVVLHEQSIEDDINISNHQDSYTCDSTNLKSNENLNNNKNDIFLSNENKLIPSKSIIDGEIYEAEKVNKSKMRYFNLLVLSLALFLNAELWISLPSINSTLTELWDLEPSTIDWFSTIFLVVYAIQIIPFTFLPQIIGLRWCIVGGSICNFVGALFRLISFSLLESPKTFKYSFGICMTGNFFAAFGQGFLLFLPPLLSFEWFSPKERTFSTTVSVMSNVMGTAIGFLFVFLMLTNLMEYIIVNRILMISSGVESTLGLFILLLAFFISRKKPTNSNLNTVSDEESINLRTSKGIRKSFITFWIQTRNLFKNRFIYPLLFTYGTYYAISTAFYTFLDDMINTYLTNKTDIVGYLGSVGIIMGTVTTVFMGYLMQKIPNHFHQYISSFFCLLAAIVSIILILLIHFNRLYVSLSFIFVILYAISAAPFLSFGFELLSDVSYPIPANVSSSAGLISANIFGILMTYGYGFIDHDIRYYVFLSMNAVLYFIGFLLLSLIKYHNARMSSNTA